MNDVESLSENQALILDTINGVETREIPIWQINPMEHRMIDRIAGLPEGSYIANPEPTYLAMLQHASCCMVDQNLWSNPLSMGQHGFESGTRLGATTGAQQIVRDGMIINSPEAVVEHLEKQVFPNLINYTECVDLKGHAQRFLDNEQNIQIQLGSTILKTPHGKIGFPGFCYGEYGYENYFMAYGLYPEVMEKHYSLQADLWAKLNGATARAYAEGGLPPYHRLDHDMCDSRGPLVDIKSLDEIWFPHFARAIEPLTHTNIKMIWHCDGNVTSMVPRLIDSGISGFQGFQYETGVDYEQICKMKTRTGDDLLIIGGVSVTTTLPHGTATDVANELKWLVSNGPKRGLILGASSSIAPGVPWENLKALIDGFAYYRKYGRR